MNHHHTDMIVQAIKNASARYGIPQSWIHDPKNHHRLGVARQARIECVAQLYNQGIPAAFIARAFGLCDGTVTKWALEQRKRKAMAP